MKKVFANNLSLLQFDGLGRQRGINHFITTRQPGLPAEFTLSLSSWPDRAVVEKNREHLASAIGVLPSKLFFPSQVHETRVVEVTSSTTREILARTDALVTIEPGICVAVMSADCVPVLLYDTATGAVAAIHAGWRGTVANILTTVLQYMDKKFGTQGKNLVAGIGPSAGPELYEVGDEVIDAVGNSFGHRHDLLKSTGKGKALFDLWGANVLQLQEFGVPQSSIEVSGFCTLKDNEVFFSARRGDRGRFAAGIMRVP